MLYKKIIFSSFILLCIIGITGCSSQYTSNDTNGKVAKDEIISELKKDTDEINDITKKNGYLKSDEFQQYEHKINIIAESINSSTKIKMNDTEYMKKSITDLEKNTESLSNEEALQAKKRMNSSKTIYKEVFMNDLHLIMDSTDLQSSNNKLHMYVDINSDNSKTTEEKIKNAKDDISLINSFTYKPLNQLQSEINNYSKVLNNDEESSLHLALQYLQSSLDKQVAILQQFGGNSTDTNQTLTEQVDIADTDFKNAKQIIDKLENKFDVTYVEPSQK
ncbi:hypothetical protein [Ectobacillus polymachus]|uniref:hypothetical protein n=1 Tax=Ectobacillus polymachus TaxID=1508806 RepID=UPI003A88A6E1